MALKSIQIENFKGFHAESTNPFILDNLNPGLNLLVGHPNTGKTTVMEAALFALQHPPGNDFCKYYPLWRGEGTGFQRLQDFEKLFPYHSRQVPLVITLQTDLGDGHSCHAILGSDDFARDCLIITDIVEHGPFHEWERDRVRQTRQVQLFENSNEEFVCEPTPGDFIRLDIAYYIFARNFMPQLQEHTIRALQDLRVEEQVRQYLRDLSPNIRHVRVNGRQLIFYDARKRVLPLSYMGTGFIKFTQLLLPLLTFSNRIFLIDEIADSLHWENILQLLRILFRLLRERQIQIIATSHSFDILDVLTKNYKEFEEFHDLLTVHRFLQKDRQIQLKQTDWHSLQNIFPAFVDVRAS